MIIEGNYYEPRFGEVRVNGVMLDPRPSQKVWNHSPDGFAWGYGGSGPAQLALAILLAAGVPEREAVALHHRFKVAFIATLPRRSFKINADVDAWVRENKPTSVVPSGEREDNV